MPETTGVAGDVPGDHPGHLDRLGPAVRFSLLGRVEIRVGGRDVAPSTPRTLHLLSLLLAAEGAVVGLDTVVEELWGDRPPRRARSAVQTGIHQLRRVLAPLLLDGSPEELLVTRAHGYVLAVDPDRVDLTCFAGLCRAGRDDRAASRPAAAVDRLRAADALWGGPPMADVALGPVLGAVAAELLERRWDARVSRIEAELDLGRHRELLAELHTLAAAHPYDEALAALRIRALGRSGRQAEAMGAFRDLHDRLATELGVLPGPGVAEARRALLTRAIPGAGRTVSRRSACPTPGWR